MLGGKGDDKHDEDDHGEEEPATEYERLSKRIEECMSLLEFLGDFKEAFDKHSQDFEEQSAEWEDFMDEMRTDVDEIKRDLKDAKETSKKQDVELMNAIKVLSKTFDKETYDRFTQSEEIQRRFDELQRVKDEVRGESRASQERASSMMELIDNLKHTLDVQQHEKLTRDEELEKSFAKIEQMRLDFEQGFEFHRKETMELLTAVDILSKTFDNETYERSVQGEEVHRWIEDAKMAVDSVKDECMKQRDATGDLLGAIDQLKVAIDREERERVDLGMQLESLNGFKNEIETVHKLQAEERNDMKEMVKKLGSSYDVETMERIQQAEKVEDYLTENKKMLESVKLECLSEAQAMNELLGAVSSMKSSLETEVNERLSDNDHIVRMLEESSIAMKRGGIAISSSMDRLKGSLNMPRPMSEIEKATGVASTAGEPEKEVLSRYKIDGSKIPAHMTRNAGGLAYRKTPKMDDKSAYNVAPWGSFVWGKQEGDFVKVGNRYLPMFLNGEQVLMPAGKEDEDEEPETQGEPLRSDEKILETSRKVKSAAKKIKRLQARQGEISQDPEPEAEVAPAADSAELQRAVNHLQTQFAHERSERILLFTEVVSLRDQMVPKLQALERGPNAKIFSSAPIEASSIYTQQFEEHQANKKIDELSSRCLNWDERLNDMELSFQTRFDSLSTDIQNGTLGDAEPPAPVKDPEIEARLASLERLLENTASKDVLGTSVNDMETRLDGYENKITSLADQIKSQVTKLDMLASSKTFNSSRPPLTDREFQNEIQSKVQEAMRKNSETLEETQADLAKRLDKLTSLNTIDIDSRLKAQEAKTSTMSTDISSQVQQSLKSYRERTDELAEQQGKVQSNFLNQLSESKMFHAEQLSKATSSLRTEIQDLIKSQLSTGPAQAIKVDSGSLDANAIQSIAELKAQVVSLVTADPVSREEFQDQMDRMYLSLSEREGGGAGTDGITRKDFESNNRNLWEAIMQLQIKQLEESKQKAREQFETSVKPPSVSPRAVSLQGSLQAQPGPARNTPAKAAPGSPASPPRTVVAQVTQPVSPPQQVPQQLLQQLPVATAPAIMQTQPQLRIQNRVNSAGNLAAAYQMTAGGASPSSSRPPSRVGSPHPTAKTVSPTHSYSPAPGVTITQHPPVLAKASNGIPSTISAPGSPRLIVRTNSFTSDTRTPSRPGSPLAGPPKPMSSSFTVSQVQGS